MIRVLRAVRVEIDFDKLRLPRFSSVMPATQVRPSRKNLSLGSVACSRLAEGSYESVNRREIGSLEGGPSE